VATVVGWQLLGPIMARCAVFRGGGAVSTGNGGGAEVTTRWVE
jgi:hypothetical protein